MQPSPAITSNEQVNKEYTIQRLTKEKLKDVEKLYEAVYHRTAPEDYFNIKYDSAYTGVEYTGFLAYDKAGLPIAYYGVIPCFLQCGDQRILAAQSADTMTHPQARYKGLFLELSRITFDLCRENGIRLIFGFPNQHSYHGAVNKLGWKMTDTMECFIIPVKPGIYPKFLKKIARSLYDSYVERVIEGYRTQFENIPNSVLTDAYCGVRRDLKYMAAKDYFPREILKIENCLVWCKITDEFIIGDMEIAPVKFVPALEEIISIAAQLGLKQVQFHSSPETGLHTLFAAQYKSTPSFPVLFQVFDQNININNIKFNMADIDIF